VFWNLPMSAMDKIFRQVCNLAIRISKFCYIIFEVDDANLLFSQVFVLSFGLIFNITSKF
jgi:hypothetical protein